MESMRRLEARVDDMCEQFGARISILEARWSAADTFIEPIENTNPIEPVENTTPTVVTPQTPQKKSSTIVDDSETPARDYSQISQRKSGGAAEDNNNDDDASPVPDYAWPMDLVLY